MLIIRFVVHTYRLKNSLKNPDSLDIFDLLRLCIYIKVCSGISSF